MTSLLIALLASATPPAASDKPTTLLTMEPLDLIGGNLSASLEHSIGRSVTLLVGATAGAQTSTFGSGDFSSHQLTYGGGLILGARWFTGGAAPFGFWMGPKVWARASGGEETDPIFGTTFYMTSRLFGFGVSGQLLAGYTQALGPIAVEVGGGLGAYWDMTSQTPTALASLNSYRAHIGPELYFALGWAL